MRHRDIFSSRSPLDLIDLPRGYSQKGALFTSVYFLSATLQTSAGDDRLTPDPPLWSPPFVPSADFTPGLQFTKFCYLLAAPFPPPPFPGKWGFSGHPMSPDENLFRFPESYPECFFKLALTLSLVLSPPYPTPTPVVIHPIHPFNGRQHSV